MNCGNCFAAEQFVDIKLWAKDLLSMTSQYDGEQKRIMELKSIVIKDISGGCLNGNCENIRHIKSLPCLSVVQPICGYYEIGLDQNTPVVAEEGGAFVAPAGVMQNITHHNGTCGNMEAQWVFMNIIVNDFFDFQDFFDLPLLISKEHREALSALIFVIRNDPDICKKYVAAYQLTDLLIAHSSVKKKVSDNVAIMLKRYIDAHYNEKITKEDLANVAFCSVPNLYHIFQKNFGISPHNYVNKIRLEKASVLLENSGSSVAEISAMVGFDDPIYFSKLFKENYRLSPKKYRESSLYTNTEK